MRNVSLNIGVGVFIFNRPEHARQVFDSLKRNGIPKLYIFCDGPRDGIMTDAIKKTREIAGAVDWCETEIVFHEKNLGTVENIVQGINLMCRTNDAVIVLEDDCLVRKEFYDFMSSCLDYYKDNPTVMHVNGYQLPVEPVRNSDYDIYFSTSATSWGFGLWKRSWPYFRMNIEDAADFCRSRESERITRVVPNFEQSVREVLSGRVNSFIFRWNFLVNREGGFCVSPYKTFVRNIGWDGTGVHCRRSRRFAVDAADWEEDYFDAPRDFYLPEEILQNELMDQRTRVFYKKSNFIKNVVKRLLR